MTENSQDRWCVSLAAGWGPHQLPQRRSLALVSILQSLAAAEIANALHLRDFRSPAIFEFSTQSARSGRSEHARGESLHDQSGLKSFARYRATRRAGVAEGL